MSHPNLPEEPVVFGCEELEQTIPSRFEEQVAKYPSNVAVQTDDTRLTYDELNRTANRLARAIQAREKEERHTVALLLENGAGVIAAMLAALKAGEAYVPIDPTYPPSRITHMVEHSDAGLIVTDKEHVDVAKELAGGDVPCLCVDEVDAGLSDRNLEGAPASPDAVAAIYYTSGSMGVPKGVQHTHRGFDDHIDVYRFGFRFPRLPREQTHMLDDVRHPVRLLDDQVKSFAGFFFCG